MGLIALKVGELAKKTGVSVRTLHYYDEIGLLCPSHWTDAGYRLYTTDDLVRLQQIISLRYLGFTLEQIKSCLDSKEYWLQTVIERHLVRLRDQIEAQRRLCAILEAALHRFQSHSEISVTDLIQTIKEVQMFEKYYTPEQLEELKQRGEQIGRERIQQVQREWQELMDQVRAEMDKGTDPAAEPMQSLARRWQGLIDEFTGGNPKIEQSLKNMYRHEGPAIGQQHGFDYDSQMFEYVGQAITALTKQTGS